MNSVGCSCLAHECKTEEATDEVAYLHRWHRQKTHVESLYRIESYGSK